MIDSKDISPVVKQAMVAVEDRRFWEHRGVDVRGIARAAWADVQKKELVQGGSTITQQFIKNTLTQDDRTVSRKLKEATLAWQLERRWSKDRILTAYLNTVYFGNGAYGIQMAARVYFDKKARDLTLPEAALLAGIPVEPVSLTTRSRARARRAQRRTTVLGLMLEQGLITAVGLRARRRGQDAEAEGHPRPRHARARAALRRVREAAADRGVRLGRGLRRRAQDHDDARPRPPADRPRVRARSPRERGRALGGARRDRPARRAGARDVRRRRPSSESQFNLAVQGERQSGSAFKPFVLAAALSAGISPSTGFDSKPTSINLGDKLWTVANYENSYLGPTNLYEATTFSDNSVYAQLTALVGPKPRRRRSRTPLGDHERAQRVLRDRARRRGGQPARDGARVRDVRERRRARRRPRPRQPPARRRHGQGRRSGSTGTPRSEKQVLDPNQNAILTAMLQDVVRDGTGKRAAISTTAPVAGKTGTTENYGDAWFVGYTPQLSVAVWVGYPNKLIPMETEFERRPGRRRHVPGAPLEVVRGEGAPVHERAAGVVPVARVPVGEPGQRHLPRRNSGCSTTATASGRAQVLYTPGFAPTQTADCKPNEVDVPHVVGARLEKAEARLASACRSRPRS